MENILSSAGSLCYMQKMPKAPAGVEIVSGAAPDNDPTKLFAPPAGATDRLVKVVVSNFPGEEQGDQKIFIRIFAQDTNADAGNAYKHLIYFCSGNDANPNGYEQTTIKPNGNYEGFNLGSDEQGDYEATITAKLITQGNKLSFDPNSKRQAEVASVNDQSKFFKSFLEIANNKIKNKNLDSFGSDVRKAYNVARYSGANIQTLRFVEGGVKDDNFQAITEFRGTSYRAAPENTEFNQDLNAVDLDTDSFYLSSPSVDTSDLATFDCAAEADVVVTMDMGNEQLQEFVADCEGQRLNGMNFCNEDSDISNAEQNFNSACFQN